jgi:hypothetical protein
MAIGIDMNWNSTISIHCIPVLKRFSNLIMVTILNVHDFPKVYKDASRNTYHVVSLSS